MYWDQIQIDQINKRLELIEKVFSKILQLDVRLQTVEFLLNLPTDPSVNESLMDIQYRLERLESFL